MQPTKLLCWFCGILLVAAVAPMKAQTQTQLQADPTSSPPLAYSVAAQDRDSILWQAMEMVTNSAGIVQKRLHQYKQMETGQSAWDGTAWRPTSTALAITESGITGTKTVHRVALGPTLTSNPLVDVTLPDSQHCARGCSEFATRIAQRAPTSSSPL